MENSHISTRQWATSELKMVLTLSITWQLECSIQRRFAKHRFTTHVFLMKNFSLKQKEWYLSRRKWSIVKHWQLFSRNKRRRKKQKRKKSYRLSHLRMLTVTENSRLGLNYFNLPDFIIVRDEDFLDLKAGEDQDQESEIKTDLLSKMEGIICHHNVGFKIPSNSTLTNLLSKRWKKVKTKRS